MGKITYTLSNFVAEKAKQGALVVAVTQGTTGSISNVQKSGSSWIVPSAFKGAGVCKVKGDIYSLTANSVLYEFNEYGYGTNANASGLELKLGSITSDVISAGNDVTATTSSTTTRTAGGDTSQITDATTQICIDSMTPRDQFANQALKGIISHVEDPATLSPSVMIQYCEAAYQWADKMMQAAANARSKLIDDTAQETAEVQAVGSFESNTEKLLNNIIVALEKTDASIETLDHWYKEGENYVFGPCTNEVAQTLPHGDGPAYTGVEDALADGWRWARGRTVYAERTSNPELNTFLSKYIDDGNNGIVGLKDLISVLGDIHTDLGDIVTALGNIKDAIVGQ